MSFWSESDDTTAALANRPDHGFSWVSPTLSDNVQELLAAELLSQSQRDNSGFPTMPAWYTPAGNKSRNVLKASGINKRPLPRPSSTNSSSAAQPKYYAALVVDCEMVELVDHTTDLVRVSVIDFFTGESVLDNLVQPTARVKDWRSRVSGVDPALLRAAHHDPSQTVLKGWPDAQARILAVSDTSTIFIGHALANDLKVLHIAADRVVDSLVLVAQAAFGRHRERFPRSWSLRTACEQLPRISIQKSRCAHDPREDTLATRELVIWALTHPKDILTWGARMKTEHEKKEEERREKEKKLVQIRRMNREKEEAEMLQEMLARVDAEGQRDGSLLVVKGVGDAENWVPSSRRG